MEVQESAISRTRSARSWSYKVHYSLLKSHELFNTPKLNSTSKLGTSCNYYEDPLSPVNELGLWGLRSNSKFQVASSLTASFIYMTYSTNTLGEKYNYKFFNILKNSYHFVVVNIFWKVLAWDQIYHIRAFICSQT